jgi:hypothetical protein
MTPITNTPYVLPKPLPGSYLLPASEKRLKGKAASRVLGFTGKGGSIGDPVIAEISALSKDIIDMGRCNLPGLILYQDGSALIVERTSEKVRIIPLPFVLNAHKMGKKGSYDHREEDLYRLIKGNTEIQQDLQKEVDFWFNKIGSLTDGWTDTTVSPFFRSLSMSYNPINPNKNNADHLELTQMMYLLYTSFETYIASMTFQSGMIYTPQGDWLTNPRLNMGIILHRKDPRIPEKLTEIAKKIIDMSPVSGRDLIGQHWTGDSVYNLVCSKNAFNTYKKYSSFDLRRSWTHKSQPDISSAHTQFKLTKRVQSIDPFWLENIKFPH